MVLCTAVGDIIISTHHTMATEVGTITPGVIITSTDMVIHITEDTMEDTMAVITAGVLLTTTATVTTMDMVDIMVMVVMETGTLIHLEIQTRRITKPTDATSPTPMASVMATQTTQRKLLAEAVLVQGHVILTRL